MTEHRFPTASESEQKKQRVIQTIHDMVEMGEVLTFTDVARRAGVSRRFLYIHEELRSMVKQGRVLGTTAELQAENAKLRLKVLRLKEALEKK